MRVYANPSNPLVEFGVGAAGGGSVGVVVTTVSVFLGLYGWMIGETVCKKEYVLWNGLVKDKRDIPAI